MRNDSKERYATVTRLLHWGMALLIGWQALKVFDRIVEGEHGVSQTLVFWHISIDTLLLVVMLHTIWATTLRCSTRTCEVTPGLRRSNNG